MSANDWLQDTRTSYDTVARSYGTYARDSFDNAPYLRCALAQFAEMVRSAGGGLVADVGCGPGLITAQLHKLGIDVFGIDLSPGMVDTARRENPGLRFEIGSMTELDIAVASLAGLIAWWSLIHIPDESLPDVLGRFHQALRPGGLLQIGFHVGEGSRLKTEGYGGHPMKVTVYRRQPAQMAELLRRAGFSIEAQMLLQPDADLPQAVLFARCGS